MPDSPENQETEAKYHVQLITLQKCFAHLSKAVLLNALEGLYH